MDFRKPLMFFLGFVLLIQVGFAAIMLWHDTTKVMNQREDVRLQEGILQDMSEEEIMALVEEFEDPTTKAQLSLKAAEKRHAKWDRERADMNPRFSRDCWTRGSLKSQIDRINEVLGTPNEPEGTKP